MEKHLQNSTLIHLPHPAPFKTRKHALSLIPRLLSTLTLTPAPLRVRLRLTLLRPPGVLLAQRKVGSHAPRSLRRHCAQSVARDERGVGARGESLARVKSWVGAASCCWACGWAVQRRAGRARCGDAAGGGFGFGRLRGVLVVGALRWVAGFGLVVA